MATKLARKHFLSGRPYGSAFSVFVRLHLTGLLQDPPLSLFRRLIATTPFPSWYLIGSSFSTTVGNPRLVRRGRPQRKLAGYLRALGRTSRTLGCAWLYIGRRFFDGRSAGVLSPLLYSRPTTYVQAPFRVKLLGYSPFRIMLQDMRS